MTGTFAVTQHRLADGGGWKLSIDHADPCILIANRMLHELRSAVPGKDPAWYDGTRLTVRGINRTVVYDVRWPDFPDISFEPPPLSLFALDCALGYLVEDTPGPHAEDLWFLPAGVAGLTTTSAAEPPGRHAITAPIPAAGWDCSAFVRHVLNP